MHNIPSWREKCDEDDDLMSSEGGESAAAGGGAGGRRSADEMESDHRKEIKALEGAKRAAVKKAASTQAGTKKKAALKEAVALCVPYRESTDNAYIPRPIRSADCVVASIFGCARVRVLFSLSLSVLWIVVRFFRPCCSCCSPIFFFRGVVVCVCAAAAEGLVCVCVRASVLCVVECICFCFVFASIITHPMVVVVFGVLFVSVQYHFPTKKQQSPAPRYAS
jgi:hypothetical protein